MQEVKLTGFVQDLFDQIDTLLSETVQNGYTSIMHYISAPLGLLVIIAISLMGYRVWIGFGEGVKASDFLKFVITCGLVYTFAMNWTYFSSYGIDLFNKGLIDGISSALLSTSKTPTEHSLNGAIQNCLSTISAVSSNVLDAAGWEHKSYFLFGGLMYVFGVIMMALMIVEVVVAKVMMAVLFTIAPLIIPTTLFKRFETIFNNWLGNLFGFSLLLIMLTVLLAIATGLVTWVLPESSAHISSGYFDYLADRITIFLILAIVIIVLIMRVSATAMHIGGGVSGAGVGAVIGGALAGAGFSVATMKSSFKVAGAGYKAGKWGAGKARGALRKLRGGE